MFRIQLSVFAYDSGSTRTKYAAYMYISVRAISSSPVRFRRFAPAAIILRIAIYRVFL